MKIFYFVDHTSRYAGCSGVQRVVRGLARALLDAGCELVFVGWCPKQKALVPIDQSMLNNLAKFQGPALVKGTSGLYPVDVNKSTPLHEGIFAPSGQEWLVVPEVTHITYHAVPPTQGIMEYCSRHGLKTAFVYYDAIPLKHPDYADAEPKHSEYMQQLALADLIIPISQYAADDLVSFYLNRLYFQVETLPEIAPLLLPAEVPDRERQMPSYSGNPPRLFLAVGTIEPRKNQLGLLQAFQRFCDEHPEHEAQLVLIGNIHPAVAEDILKAVQKNPKTKYLEYADDKTLNDYYVKCDFTVFPSIEEGYGLPIVESLWFGKPCLCANFGSMGEVAKGGGCMTVDTVSVEDIHSALSRLLLQPELLCTLKDAIKVRKFTTWFDYGLQVKRLLDKEDAPSARIRKIYYWVDHTRSYPSNSGIQRVVRGLASSLQKANIPVVPVGWDTQTEELVIPSESDLIHLEKWNGPEADMWEPGLPSEDESGAWLLIPELLTYQVEPNLPSISNCIPSIVSYARKRNIRVGIIFFDAIPYKMTELYTVEAQHAHAEYMRLLSLFDQVLCISEQSKLDLLQYLRAHLGRMVNIEQRIKAVLLSAELSGIERQEATQRMFKTWQEYGQDVLRELASGSVWRARVYPPENVAPTRSAFHSPILSICISTYNRAPWLALSLPLLLKQIAAYRDIVEVVVCDNTSTDDTPKIVEPYLDEPGFYYIRNPENVGMLGNLRVTAQHAQGQYVWILGDDDLLCHGTVERVIKAILEHPDVSLVYLNYAYTHIADAEMVGDIEQFLKSGIPIRPPCPDLFAPIATLSTVAENFFTAIYCLVYRRDHALRAYSQNTDGRPFSTMLTCIPTSHYVCQHMMNESGYWIGEPGLVVNMNVSWGKYAPLWVLERLPELYDLAEQRGANPNEVDRWRVHNLPETLHYLKQIYFYDTENNIQYFSIERFIARHKHLREFKSSLRDFMAIYEEAYKNGHYAAPLEPVKLLGQFGLS